MSLCRVFMFRYSVKFYEQLSLLFSGVTKITDMSAVGVPFEMDFFSRRNPCRTEHKIGLDCIFLPTNTTNHYSIGCRWISDFAQLVVIVGHLMVSSILSCPESKLVWICVDVMKLCYLLVNPIYGNPSRIAFSLSGKVVFRYHLCRHSAVIRSSSLNYFSIILNAF